MALIFESQIWLQLKYLSFHVFPKILNILDCFANILDILFQYMYNIEFVSITLKFLDFLQCNKKLFSVSFGRKYIENKIQCKMNIFKKKYNTLK